MTEEERKREEERREEALKKIDELMDEKGEVNLEKFFEELERELKVHIKNISTGFIKRDGAFMNTDVFLRLGNLGMNDTISQILMMKVLREMKKNSHPWVQIIIGVAAAILGSVFGAVATLIATHFLRNG